MASTRRSRDELQHKFDHLTTNQQRMDDYRSHELGPPVGGGTVPDDSISLYDLLRVPFERWRFVLASTTIGAVLIFSYALLTLYLPSSSPWNLLPNIYRSEASVLLLDHADSRQYSLVSDRTPFESRVRSSAKAAASRSVKRTAALATELLAGRTIQDQIIDEFGFIGPTGFNERARARQMLNDSFRIRFDESSSVMTISYESTTAQLSAAVLERALVLLSERLHTIVEEPRLERRRHMEDRLRIVADVRKVAQTRLQAFQVTSGFLHPDEQRALATNLSSNFRRRILSNELQLRSLRGVFRGSDPAIATIVSETAVLRRAVDELHGGFNEFSAVTIPESEFPGTLARYRDLRRDLDFYTRMHDLLRSEYALAINLGSHIPAFTIIETAEIPTTKLRPSRSRICRIATVIVFGLSTLLVFVFEYWRNLITDPTQTAKLNRIRTDLAGGSFSRRGDTVDSAT